MTIIGIDVSKKELIGVRINRAGKEVENYKFENNSDSINIFLHDANQKHKHLVIACESTSYFHRNLALACIKAGIPFRLINPITTKQFIKVTVRGRKTDMSDALIIAKLALHGEGRYMQMEDFSFTKSISRTASKLSEMERSIGRMINRLNTVEDEEKYVVNDVLKTCRETLETSMKKLRKYLHKRTDSTLEKLFYQLSEAIELSNVNLAITSKNGDIIFYPIGETTLDKVLIDEVLSFLNKESQKHFIDALNFYLNFSTKNTVKSAESIRRSLEEFLRFKLQNQKGLKENVDELQKRLKSEKCDPILRNIIFHIFSYLDTYFNENSKHKDGNIDEPENEFLVYQSGLLMRYIHKVIP